VVAQWDEKAVVHPVDYYKSGGSRSKIEKS
jgi:hypothetical protein